MTKKLNKRKVPSVVIDKSLEKYNDMELFPDKVAKANEMLRTVGLPRTLNKQTKHKLKKRPRRQNP